MKINRAQLFTGHPEARRILDEVIDYIGASLTNPTLWKIIQELAAEERAKLFEKANTEPPAKTGFEAMRQTLPYELAEPQTFFSIDFFLSLSAKLAELYGSDDNGGLLHPVGEAFELLLETSVLVIPYAVFSRDAYRGSVPTPKNQPYRINASLAPYLIDNGLIYNHLFGFNYIIERYTASVVKIEVKQGEDLALGTGWLCDIRTHYPLRPVTRLVVTNDHVLAGSSQIRVLTKDDKPLPYHGVELFQASTGVDLALLRVDYDEATPAFLLHPGVSLLEEIITIGYPSVPLAREAYQLVHRGEVNAQVTDYYGQDLLVISARTAPGNSGSPVIDDTGRVVGMVTQELFEKEAFQQKGITPYSACIPAITILRTIYKSVLLWPPTSLPSPPPPSSPSSSAPLANT